MELLALVPIVYLGKNVVLKCKMKEKGTIQTMLLRDKKKNKFPYLRHIRNLTGFITHLLFYYFIIIYIKSDDSPPLHWCFGDKIKGQELPSFINMK